MKTTSSNSNRLNRVRPGDPDLARRSSQRTSPRSAGGKRPPESNTKIGQLPQAIEEKLERGAAILGDRLYQALTIGELTLPDGASKQQQLELFSQCCADSDGILSTQYDELQSVHGLYLRANITYLQDRSRTVVNEGVDADRWLIPDLATKRAQAVRNVMAPRAREAIDKLVASLLEQLKLKPYLLLGGPYLTHERIKQCPDLDTLLQQGVAFFQAKARRAAEACVDGFRQAVRQGLYGWIDFAADYTSVAYSFCTHRVVDAVDSETIEVVRHRRTNDVVAEIGTSRNTERCGRRHDLICPVVFSLESTLKSPDLEIPEHYRRVLEQTPEQAADLLYTVFGTQTVEQQVAYPVDSEQLVERVTLAKQVRVDREPCCVWFDAIVPFGWGKTTMLDQQQLYEEHIRVINDKRCWEAESLCLRSEVKTRWRLGVMLLVLLALELWLLSYQSLAIAFAVLFAPGLFAVQLLFNRRLKAKARAIELLGQDRYERNIEQLRKKYPALDPDRPRLPLDTQSNSDSFTSRFRFSRQS